MDSVDVICSQSISTSPVTELGMLNSKTIFSVKRLLCTSDGKDWLKHLQQHQVENSSRPCSATPLLYTDHDNRLTPAGAYQAVYTCPANHFISHSVSSPINLFLPFFPLFVVGPSCRSHSSALYLCLPLLPSPYRSTRLSSSCRSRTNTALISSLRSLAEPQRISNLLH